ncbi:MAG: ABC transporter permease subunit, partial [Eubacteriales bacterium]
IFAILSAMSIGVESELFYIMEFYSVISYVLASVFFAIAVLISSSVSKIEQSAMFSNMAFFVAFGMAVVYDCVENTKWIQPFSPLRYFTYEDVLQQEWNGWYLMICLMVIIISLVVGYNMFQRKDMK